MNDAVKITLGFHGAAKQVTGSCHLLEYGDTKVLIDCGMFQGGRELEEENAEPFGFDPAEVNFLFLTHAHLDHCGRIPLLVKRGFQGEIITTPPTRELARLVMMDAAGIQEEDAERARRQAHRHGENHIEPLYDTADALHAMDFFGRTVGYGETLPIVDGLRVTFIDAGHILGSAAVVVEMEHNGEPLRVLFSGDLGNPGRPILRDPAVPPEVDYVVMETTYGDRPHRGIPDSIDELYTAVGTTLARGGNVIIPSFALERTQEILYYLRHGIDAGRLPPHLPVFLDSPMAISATEIFRRHTGYFDPAFLDELAGRDPFDLPGLHFTRSTADSMAVNRIDSGAVIIAGSGMCTGGRVRHHLKHNLWREQCSVVFVGYAAEGTLARRIVDGAREVRLFHDNIRVRAQIWTINGFSAHAGQDTLLEWLSHTGKPKQVLLVHGEPDRGMSAMIDKLAERGYAWHVPGMHERIKLA